MEIYLLIPMAVFYAPRQLYLLIVELRLEPQLDQD